MRIKQARGYNKAAVALANKNARIIWALLTRSENYRPPIGGSTSRLIEQRALSAGEAQRLNFCRGANTDFCAERTPVWPCR